MKCSVSRLVFAAIFVVLSAVISSGKIVNPRGGGPDSALLRSVANSLDRNEIDVVLGKATQFPLTGRPRLASIAGFTPNKTGWDTYLRQTWAYAFDGGVIGVLVATKMGTETSLDQKRHDCEAGVISDAEPCEFVARWLGADEE